MSLRIFFVFFLLCGLSSNAQEKGRDTAAVNRLIDQSKQLNASDSAKAIELARKAKDLAEEIGYQQGEAYALKNIGMVYYMRGIFGSTLDYWQSSLELFQAAHDDKGTANMLNNIGAIYLNQGADDKALEYSLKSLQLAEKTGDTMRMYSALTNVGGIYHNKKDPAALPYLLRAVGLVESGRNNEAYVVITGNVGEVYFDYNNLAKALEFYQKSIAAARGNSEAAFSYNGVGKVYLAQGNFELALENHNKALAIAQQADDKFQIVRAYRGIADVYTKQGKHQDALAFFKKAEATALQMDDPKVEFMYLYGEMSGAYAQISDFRNAYKYKTLYSNFRDSNYTTDMKKKLNKLEFDRDLSKKQSEIDLKEARIESEKQARIGMTIGLVLLLAIAFIIYRNYLQKARTNKILDRQKEEIEGLLLNILPQEVATELQTSGESRPRHFEEVSVLFTDFKGFTSIADKLSPQEVVVELNHCFVAFDNIMEKYDLEKIKTIGDAYMCAGNIPAPDKGHAAKIIKAALEIQQFMHNYNVQRREKGLEPWEIRLGVHVGPVVAGVVGKRKYAYDIWGSTVNIASRMESNSSPGRVNISRQAYDMVKDQFACSYRGKISVKNLGELDMYFVDHEKEPGEATNGVHENNFVEKVSE